eukprot:714955-Pelagomonas_calceolata.AAC.1
MPRGRKGGGEEGGGEGGQRPHAQPARAPPRHHSLGSPFKVMSCWQPLPLSMQWGWTACPEGLKLHLM